MASRGVSDTRSSSDAENSVPITAAVWSRAFSDSASRSMRAANTAWTLAGISSDSSSRVIVAACASVSSRSVWILAWSA